MGGVLSSFVFHPPPTRPSDRVEVDGMSIVHCPKTGVALPVLYVKSQRSTQRQTTLLLAHGNAEDLSMVETVARELVERLGVGVCAFEYPGYGTSAWLDETRADALQPSEELVLGAAEEVLEWLVTQVPLEDVIFYGVSLGSGAAVHLAAACGQNNLRCGGLILHSPIASVLRTALPRLRFTVPVVDMFVNIDKIALIKCRATVLHGTADEVVSVACARALNDAIPLACRADPLYIANGHHNDLIEYDEFFAHLNLFIAAAVAQP